LDITLDRVLEDDAELRKMCSEGRALELMQIAQALEGMPRNASIHAAGVVLTDRPVSDYVPLAINTGAKVTQYTMNEIADLGLLKIDFLGLRYLTIIRDAVEEIHRTDPGFDIRSIPLDHKKTYEMISRGETAGMFQIESSGMKALMLQMKPTSIEDITAAIALSRPGPKDSIPRFLENRKNGDTKHEIEELNSILGNTHGCIVYQEQVMEIFRKLAGYSFGRADIVRRAMSKKKQDVMERERHFFLYGLKNENGTVECEGALARGIPEDAAKKVFDDMADFAKYAFNKSHAAAYALLSYRTAYLKCNYSKEYMAAILTSQLDSDKYAYYFSECQRMGISILPPDLNESQLSFSVSGNALRFGFVGIKNVGEALIENIFRERHKCPFSSFHDFVNRMCTNGLNKKALQSLILSGALDRFGVPRSQQMAASENVLETAKDRIRSNMPGQISLFDLAFDNPETPPPVSFPDIPEFSNQELLKGEKSVCGVYLSGHPLRNLQALAQRIGASEIITFRSEANRFSDSQSIVLICLINSVTLKQLRSGEKMAFLQVEDQTGMCEVILFPKILAKFSSLLTENTPVVIYGKINTKDEEIKILADRITTTEEAERIAGVTDEKKSKNSAEKIVNFQTVSKIFLRFPEKNSKIERRALALIRIFPGNTPCYFYYTDTEKLFRMEGLACSFTPRVYQELIELLGKENVGLK